RSADRPHPQAGVHRRRARPAAHRGTVLRLPRRRRDPDPVHRHAQGGAAHDRAQGHRHQDQRADRSVAVQTPRFLSPRLLLSCAEASGDLYAGALTRELRALDPATTVSGLGGPQFAAAGGILLDDYRDIAVTGLTEAIAKIPRSFAALRRLVAAARRDRPDVLVVIDSPDFNLRLAARVRPLGVPIVYYI